MPGSSSTFSPRSSDAIASALSSASSERLLAAIESGSYRTEPPASTAAASIVKSATIAPLSMRLRASSRIAPRPSSPIDFAASGAMREMNDGSSPLIATVPFGDSVSRSILSDGIGPKRCSTRTSAPSTFAPTRSDPCVAPRGVESSTRRSFTAAAVPEPSTAIAPDISSRARATRARRPLNSSLGTNASSGTSTLSDAPLPRLETAPFVRRSMVAESMRAVASSAPEVSARETTSICPRAETLVSPVAPYRPLSESVALAAGSPSFFSTASDIVSARTRVGKSGDSKAKGCASTSSRAPPIPRAT